MNEVEAVARAVAPMMEGGREFDQMPPTRLELRQWSRSGMCSTNDATQDDATELAQAAIAALDAVRGQAEPAAWMPIETAPKDGTTIDVWRDGHRYTVYWGLPPHCCGEMGQYCDSDWHGLKEPGWICSTFGEFVGGEHHPFTHWMPLPDAPEQSNDA